MNCCLIFDYHIRFKYSDGCWTNVFLKIKVGISYFAEMLWETVLASLDLVDAISMSKNECC